MIYTIQARFAQEPQRTVLMTATDVDVIALTRLLDDIVRSGWEQHNVVEAWLYEDAELIAYVHERVFQRDMDVVADASGNAISTTIRREKRPYRRPAHKVA